MADTKLVKARGEHWVCSVLAGLGWSVALTRDGLERTDILASHAQTSRMIEVQVKAASHTAKPNWLLNKKAQQVARSDREWFVLVALAEEPWGLNRAYVVPRDHIAAAAWISHQHWLTEPGVPAGQRNASLDQTRVQAVTLTGYQNRWDLLAAAATAAPVLLPPRFRTYAEDRRVGLPPGHPWNTSLPTW